MTAVVVDGSTSFGGMVNTAIAQLKAVADNLHRANLAQESALSGAPAPAAAVLEGKGNNFGVVASATPGEQGAAWSNAVTALDTALQNFMSTNQSTITVLDNG